MVDRLGIQPGISARQREELMMDVEVGSIVKMYDWPEVTTMAFGQRKRATLRGKVVRLTASKSHGPAVDVWSAYDSTRSRWTSLRTLPLSHLIEVDTGATTKAESLAARVEGIVQARACEGCGKGIGHLRAGAKYCSKRCREATNLRIRRATPSVSDDIETAS